jgi:NAD(P)-dependent dehydrogenase (short-subunit alcohol dehydrogenase family)
MAFHIKNLYNRKSFFKQGSVVFITGAASGIGMHVALCYAKRKGTKLILADLHADQLAPVVEKVRRLGSEALAMPTDVTNREQVRNSVEAGVREFGCIDIVVLCAGVAAHHVFEHTDDLGMFRTLMEVNFYGYLNCVKETYSHLLESSGSLVAVTSFSGEVGLPYRTAYCASKFAVTGLLESLRSEMTLLRKQEGKPYFDITIVCPPTVNTNLRKSSLTVDKSLKESIAPKAMDVVACSEAIVDAADRRLRKAFFPWKSFLASYLRPLVPDAVDNAIRKRASL